MRNATLDDVTQCYNGNAPSDAMFEVVTPSGHKFLAHYKHIYRVNNGAMTYVMETNDRLQIICEIEWLRPIFRKEGTPPKHKRVCSKGTKPWLNPNYFDLVDYDPKLIKPGVKVLCSDAVIRTVEYVVDQTIMFDDKSVLSRLDGISKIFVTNSKLIHKYKYKQNTWYFWQGKTSKPPVDDATKIQIWCRSNSAAQAEKNGLFLASEFYWRWNEVSDSDIIAFRTLIQ